MTSTFRARGPARLWPRRVAAPMLTLALAVAAASGAPPAARAQTETPRAELTVTSLTGVLGPGSRAPDAAAATPDDLSLRLLVANDGEVELSNLRVVVEVYAPVEARSVLRQTLDGGSLDRPLLDVADLDVRGGEVLTPGDIAGVAFVVPGADIGWEGGGVYPVRISVLRGSEVLDRATTAVVYLAEPPTGELRTVVVWPLDTSPWRGPDGIYPSGVDAEIAPGGRLDRILSAVEASPDAPVHLAPAAHLLEDLQDRADGFEESMRTDAGVEVRTVAPEAPAAERANRFLERIRAVVADAPVPPLAGPYADDDVAGLVTAPEPLPQDAGVAVAEGRRRVQRLAGRAPDPVSYLATTPLTRDALEVLQGDHLLLPWDLVLGPDLRTNPDLPFALRSVTAPSGRRFTATIADPRVTNLLVAPDLSHGPLLAGQRLVAETGMVFFEAPSATGRPLLVLPPPDWDPHPRLPAAVLSAVVRSPWIELSSPAAQLAAVESDLPTVRFAEPALPALPDGLVTELVDAHLQLEALRAALPTDVTDMGGRSYEELSDQLLRVPSAWFRGGDVDRAADLVRDVAGAVDSAFGTVEVPSSANITLPSDTGNIPVTLQRPDAGPLRVCVEVESTGRLAWPDGERTCEVTLAGSSSQTVSFNTRALSRGRFPVTVRVTDPTGVRELGSATLTVNSTSISRPALIVTGGVVVVLLLWGSVRRRRPRRPRLEVVG